MATKKKKASGQRGHMLTIRLHDQEWKDLQEVAARVSKEVSVEIPPTAWARGQLLEAIARHLKKGK